MKSLQHCSLYRLYDANDVLIYATDWESFVERAMSRSNQVALHA